MAVSRVEHFYSRMSSKRISSEFNFAPQFKRHIGEMDVDYVFDRQAVYGKNCFKWLDQVTALTQSYQQFIYRI